MQNRFKSPVVWASMASAVVAFLLAAGVINTGLGNNINVVVETVLGFLVALGILNDPTSNSSF